LPGDGDEPGSAQSFLFCEERRSDPFSTDHNTSSLAHRHENLVVGQLTLSGETMAELDATATAAGLGTLPWR
jgi:hypothetical protein